jgi:mannose-6-phosphate isomerase
LLAKPVRAEAFIKLVREFLGARWSYAELALGFCEKMTAEEIERAIHDGTLESKLQYVPVKAGDMVYVEAGTIHAIGPGMVVLETQQYSDTTYRLYDYGRPRELHLKEGLAVTKAQTGSGLVAAVEQDGFTRLISTPCFIVDRFWSAVGASQELGFQGCMQILVALDEGASVRTSDGARVRLPAGRAVIIPAREKAQYVLEGTAKAEVIRVTAAVS